MRTIILVMIGFSYLSVAQDNLRFIEQNGDMSMPLTEQQRQLKELKKSERALADSERESDELAIRGKQIAQLGEDARNGIDRSTYVSPEQERADDRKLYQEDVVFQRRQEDKRRADPKNKIDTSRSYRRDSKSYYDETGLKTDSDTKLFFKDLWNETIGKAGRDFQIDAIVNGQKVATGK